MKKISIIIPNRNSPLIGRIIAALRRQIDSVETAEILVVGVDEPGDVKEDELVRFIPTHWGANAALNRNLARREAQGELLFFLDHDCLPAANWLESHLRRHQMGESVVGGAVTFDSHNYLQLADNVSAFHDLLPHTREGPRSYLATANLSVSRVAAEKAGAMDERLARAEDLEWTVRLRSLGYRLYFEPRAVVSHDPPRRTPRAVWWHWAADAPYTLGVRLRYGELLGTPRLAGQRHLYLWGSPIIAAWATLRVFREGETLAKCWQTLPLVFLTKLIWCWSAFWRFPTHWREDAA